MKGILEKIRTQPIEARRRVALISALTLTFVIAGSWYASRVVFVPVNVFSGTSVYQAEGGRNYQAAAAAGPFSSISERMHDLKISVWEIVMGDGEKDLESESLQVVNEETDFNIFKKAVEERQDSTIQINEI